MVRCGNVLRMVQRSYVLDFAIADYPANRCVGGHVDLCSTVFPFLCRLFVVARLGLGFQLVASRCYNYRGCRASVDPVVDPSLVVCLSCLWLCPFLCLCLVVALAGPRGVEALAGPRVVDLSL